MESADTSTPIPEAWIGQPVRVVCPQRTSSGVLGVGTRTGTLIDVNDRGVILTTHDRGERQLSRFFPWYSVYQIVREGGQEPGSIDL